MKYEESIEAYEHHSERISAFSDKVDALRLRPLRFLLQYPFLYLEASGLRKQVLKDSRLQYGELVLLLLQLHDI